MQVRIRRACTPGVARGTTAVDPHKKEAPLSRRFPKLAMPGHRRMQRLRQPRP
jgi:hypothetical protein